MDDILEAVAEFLVDVFSDGIWRDMNRWVCKYIRRKPLRILVCILLLIFLTAAVAGLAALLIYGIAAIWKAIT